MTAKKRIGVFGGSFDPVHNGHITLAERALAEFGLNSVYFVPAKQPPHKLLRKLAGAKHRLKMLALALSGKQNFKISRFELDRKTTTYSIETIKYFKKRFPGAEIFFLIGSDSLNELNLWKNPEEIAANSTVVTAKRKGVKPRGAFRNKVRFLSKTIPNISSTEIRRKAGIGRTIKGLAPEKVSKYILKNRIYRNP